MGLPHLLVGRLSDNMHNNACYGQGLGLFGDKFCILLHIITMTKHNATDIHTPVSGDSPGAGAPEIEVTPAMVKAGVYAAREHCLGEGLEELVRKVYLAMALEG
jgi:hypothetical protein